MNFNLTPDLQSYLARMLTVAEVHLAEARKALAFLQLQQVAAARPRLALARETNGRLEVAEPVDTGEAARKNMAVFMEQLSSGLAAADGIKQSLHAAREGA